MKTIQFNNKELKISASDERALRILKHQKFIAELSVFEEGQGNYRKTSLPLPEKSKAQIGIEIVSKDSALSTKEKRFFAENPRHQFLVVGNPRRINAILKSLYKNYYVKVGRLEEKS
jgi:hypothetical protein